MTENKKTPQDVRDQGEWKNYIYPTNLTFTIPIMGVNVLDTREVVYSEEGIVVNISISSNKYPKEKIRDSINQICQTLSEYFD